MKSIKSIEYNKLLVEYQIQLRYLEELLAGARNEKNNLLKRKLSEFILYTLLYFYYEDKLALKDVQ